MPALVAFGRRWNIASDDFVFPAITEGIGRLVWTTLACLVFIWNNSLKCLATKTAVHLFALVAVNVVTILVCAILALISSRGCILEPHPRRHVSTILYIRLPLFIVEFIFTILSTLLVLETGTSCPLVLGIQLIVLLQWLLIFAVLFGIAAVFNPSGNNHVERNITHERKSWMLRLKLCSVGRDKNFRNAMDDIALLIACFFADVDLVLSDILAGLFLFVHSPRTVTPPSPLCPSTTPSWMTIEAARRMIVFATAVYGWPSYLLNHCGCGDWWKLCRKLDCCKRCRCDQALIVEDNCCLCNSASFILVANCPQSDIFFVSFRNHLYQVPFVVTVDGASRSIVIAIRGSASLMDFVTDLSLDGERFSVGMEKENTTQSASDLENEDIRVHRGMLHSAKYILETLRTHHVLEDLQVLYPDYDLTICGHSLGAGVATLLTLLLKNAYPNVRCFSFSPPGCVITENGLPDTERYVMSVVVGDDVVPRISVQNMYKLKYSVIESLVNCDMAKYEILIKGLYRLFFSSPWDELHESETRARDANTVLNDRLPLIFNLSLTAEYGGFIPSSINGTASERRPQLVHLHPPGRILHLKVTDGMVDAKWIHHSALNEIKLSSAVITDHLPYYVKKVLNQDFTIQ
ncbi:hypothetical protein AB6A40_002670 [Gnathostoma spinigerum]|uniref:sn-1-specific diacylglycerol lipase n=1 Tax=Gnathostoma spinigerum TaxID=75299 RepID=A0ABD6E9T3_9BILA